MGKEDAHMIPPEEVTARPLLVRKESVGVMPAASDATTDISSNPTPEYLVKLGHYTDWMGWTVGNLYSHAGMWIALCFQAYTGHWLSWKETGWTLLMGYFKLIITFAVLHRFFAHKAFSASRPVGFLLGLVGCLGAQRGPLWWGSKHVRHHKFCENEGDPHSVTATGSFWYGFVGWTVLAKERHIDWQYVHKEFKVWEMLLVEALYPFVMYAEFYFYYRYFGLNAALMCLWATDLAVYVTLAFNIGLHHDESVDPLPDKNGRFKCRAHDKCPAVLRYTLDLMGELDHYDHHRYPRKAKHPSYLLFDLFYWCVVFPGEKAGLFYNVNTDGKGRSKVA